jgi:mannose-6-phosphate isomerase-like protein (cupin superfamily)
MRALMKVGFSLLVLAFLLIGLSYSMLRAQGISSPSNQAGRNLQSETRSLGKGVRSIDLGGPIDLTLRQGAVASLVVRGEQRLLGNIDTTVGDDGTLHIDTVGMLLHHRQPLQVTLVLASLEAINVRGSGDSTINGFSGERIEVQLNGSGNVKFNGRFKQVKLAIHGSGELEMNGGASDSVEAAVIGSGKLTVVGSGQHFKAELTGSGDIDARHLGADAVNLQLMGSGDAVVTALKSLNVVLRGSGDVTVYGEPSERNVSRDGSGSVSFEP